MAGGSILVHYMVLNCIIGILQVHNRELDKINAYETYKH